MASLRACDGGPDRHPRKPVSREETEEPPPRHRLLLRPTIEPLLPDVHNMVAKRRQALAISGNAVIGRVPTQLPHQHLVLLSNRRVTVRRAPAIDRLEAPPEASLRRLSLVHPAAAPGHSPVVRESQEVERARGRESVAVRPGAPPQWRAAESNQPTLLRVHREAEAREAFREHIWARRGRPSSTNGRRANARRRPCSGNASPRSSRQRPAPRQQDRRQPSTACSPDWRSEQRRRLSVSISGSSARPAE